MNSISYTVKIQVYEKGKETTINKESFKEALDVALGASNVMSCLGYTRHSSCQSLISHFDNYADLYNEGSVIVEKYVKFEGQEITGP